MWTCPECERMFEKTKQPHSCNKIPLEQHFNNKDKGKKLFDCLVENINSKVGKCQIVSIPCCIHLFGNYDFLAALPKKNELEIRFALNRKLDSPRLKQSVPLSKKIFKNCIDITSKEEINEELIKWLSESYFLKDKL
jgi:hypothetical protein